MVKRKRRARETGPEGKQEGTKMRTPEEIKTEIYNLNENLDEIIAAYNNGECSEEEMDRKVERYEAVIHALTWTLQK